MKFEVFEKRAAEMRQRLLSQAIPESKKNPKVIVLADRTKDGELTEPTYTLAEAARRLGVSYSTARRLCNEENVRRYRTRNGDVTYPGCTLKRFQWVRFTYVVSESDINRIRSRMRGAAA